jgi:hypothetical protein
MQVLAMITGPPHLFSEAGHWTFSSSAHFWSVRLWPEVRQGRMEENMAAQAMKVGLGHCFSLYELL